MTIAACYVSPEGVVLGADSTTTYGNPTGPHYFNHAQKLFEVGEGSSLGIVTWGLGGMQVGSHRRLLALLSDDISKTPANTLREVAERWADLFWSNYSSSPDLLPHFAMTKSLAAKAAYNANPPYPDPDARTEQEENHFRMLVAALSVGFCLGGYLEEDRIPGAYELVFSPLDNAAVTPSQINVGSYIFRGAPNMIERLLHGYDEELKQELLSCGKWNGTEADLETLLAKYRLIHPTVPLRDAVDFIHSSILSTIKAYKFSSLSQICGGPIEMAVISADRRFRWVRHKDWDSAVTEGGM